MNKSIALYLLLAGLLTGFSCTHTKQQPEEEGVDSEWLDSLQHVYQYGVCIDSLDVTEYKMKNGDNPAAIFSALGFSALKADSITKASIHVLDPTKLRAGMNYYTFTTQDSIADIRYIAFAKSLVDYAVIDLTGDSILRTNSTSLLPSNAITQKDDQFFPLECDQGKRSGPVAGYQNFGCICLADRLFRREGRGLVPGAV